MQVREVLSETVDKIIEISLDFNDLTSLQIGALRAIADERLDFENASDRMMEVVYELQDYNLVDSMFELTETGKKAVTLALKLGGSEKRAAAKRNALPEPEYDSDEDVYNDYEDKFDDDDFSEYDMNRFGSINQALGG